MKPNIQKEVQRQERTITTDMAMYYLSFLIQTITTVQHIKM